MALRKRLKEGELSRRLEKKVGNAFRDAAENVVKYEKTMQNGGCCWREKRIDRWLMMIVFRRHLLLLYISDELLCSV